MNFAFYDIVGSLGVALIVGSYFLVQIGKLSATRLAYTLSNIAGAVFILYSLIFEFNLSAFLVELFWLLISLVGLARILLTGRRQHGPS